MISLKRNSKGELAEARGIRSIKATIYSPGQESPYRVSRSKFSDFLACPRCFYLDRVCGLKEPATPGWTLNSTTDMLLKQEFDACRSLQEPHRLLISSDMAHIVPFEHPDVDRWRDALRGGLEYQIPDTNIILHGGIDDIWVDTISQTLIPVEYKSQAKNASVNTLDYLSDSYHQSYKTQIDIYAYLLVNMGYQLSDTAYFYVCNADKSKSVFGGRMDFEETLVPYVWDIDWVDGKLYDMFETLNSEYLPDNNFACENCAYSDRRADAEQMAMVI